MKKPIFISENLWENLSYKEQDFIKFRAEWLPKEKIMRKLYITTRQWYFKLAKKVSKKIINDVNKVSKIH